MAHGCSKPYEDPRAARRPFLILTRNEAIPALNQVIAVPATRTVRAIPTEVPLDRSDGMPTPCVLSLDGVTKMREVCSAFGNATAFEP